MFNAPGQNKAAQDNTAKTAETQTQTETNAQTNSGSGALGSMLSRLGTTHVSSIGDGALAKFVEVTTEIAKTITLLTAFNSHTTALLI